MPESASHLWSCRRRPLQVIRRPTLHLRPGDRCGHRGGAALCDRQRQAYDRTGRAQKAAAIYQSLKIKPRTTKIIRSVSRNGR